MNRLALAVMAVALSATMANAASLHDESADGDLPNLLGEVGNPANISFALPIGASTIAGTLDGGGSGNPDDGSDEYDTFEFTATGAFTVDLEDISGNTIAALYEDDGGGYFSFMGIGGFASSTDIFAAFGPLAPGIYAIGLAPISNIGATSYGLTITMAAPSVPLPGGLPLIATGLLGLGALARRRRVAPAPTHAHA